MFSIVIPTFNNLNYLKLCLESLKKNSSYNHQIIIFVNDGNDGTLQYVKDNNLEYFHSTSNVGLCKAVNQASKAAKKKYLIYAHDDMYFCPGWDKEFNNEILKHNNNSDFFLSGTMVQYFNGLIDLDCGKNPETFNEQRLLKELPKLKYDNFQGTTWAPSLLPLKTWKKVNGFSEEYTFGLGSDPDLNMKLWLEGVRVFKGLGNCRVYHFSSVSLRKKTWNNGAKTFLKKWGFSIKFFKKHYLRSMTKYEGPLNEPKKDFVYYYDLIITKFKYIYIFLTEFFKNEKNNS